MAEEEENEVIEEEEEECPKCPPVGAPAWMATFADMATLLMAFFILILSFAEFNVPKFKQISGSLKNAFGVQKIVPIVEQPKGTTVLSLNFSPSPAKSVTNEMTQQTTETTKPEIESHKKALAIGSSSDSTLNLIIPSWSQFLPAIPFIPVSTVFKQTISTLSPAGNLFLPVNTLEGLPMSSALSTYGLLAVNPSGRISSS